MTPLKILITKVTHFVLKIEIFLTSRFSGPTVVVLLRCYLFFSFLSEALNTLNI
jgi:hypothetical protein